MYLTCTGEKRFLIIFFQHIYLIIKKRKIQLKYAGQHLLFLSINKLL